MITQFLLNYQQELINKRMELEKSLKMNELSIKENVEFIRYIEMSEDKSYDSFSPMSLKKDANEKKLNELNEKRVILEEDNCQLKKEVKEIDNKLRDLEQIIMGIKIDETEELDNTYIADNMISSVEQKLISINNKIKLCSELIDMDRNRCKLELQNLSKLVNSLINNIYNR